MRSLSIVFLATLLGCGGSGSSGPNADQGKLAMEEFAAMLKQLPHDKRQPPAKLSEFEAVEPMAPTAAQLLKQNALVYQWGSGLKAGSLAIVLHEKKTETDGGWVLLQDGTIKKMTADEFKAAPKAGKK
jgi:hypothetical protein